LPGDDKAIAKKLRDKNKSDRNSRSIEQIPFNKLVADPLSKILDKFHEVISMPETSPVEVASKIDAYDKMISEHQWWQIKTFADIITAQFFIPKTQENESSLITDSNFLAYMDGRENIATQVKSKAHSVSAEKRFFHWFLEFPEVLTPPLTKRGQGVFSDNNSGFDLIIGNPPFLGGKRISTIIGADILNFIKYYYSPCHGGVDLVSFFFRRNFSLLKHGGFTSLISTNTVAQGDSRAAGLEYILSQGGAINFAIRSMRWPGEAAVEVALIAIHKGNWKGKFVLGNKEVDTITSYLDDSEDLGNPLKLKQNENKSFQGSIVLGKGFILEPEQAAEIIRQDEKYKDVLFPYLNGDDLNSRPDQSASRWIINFFDWPLRKYSKSEYIKLSDKEKSNKKVPFIASPDYSGPVAEDYPLCLNILKDKVKPDRDKLIAKNKQIHTYSYWQFWDSRPYLYRTIAPLERVLVITRVSKYVVITFVPHLQVFMDKVVVLSFEKYKFLALIQSSIHDHWAWKYSSTLGSSTINFAPSDCFETYPFPQNISKEMERKLETIGEKYHEHRKQLMLNMQLGLTKTYNQFHNEKLCEIPPLAILRSRPVGRGGKGVFSDQGELSPSDFQKKYGKQSYELWKHLERTDDTISYNEAVEGILELRHLHKEMDELVLAAYEWNDIKLRHNFYDVDYLPENDRTRFTIHPEARKEILKRLLLLNHQIFEEEARQGLHKKKDVEAYYEMKGKTIPSSVPIAAAKSKGKKKHIDNSTQQLF
jgi:hypothetical protein